MSRRICDSLIKNGVPFAPQLFISVFGIVKMALSLLRLSDSVYGFKLCAFNNHTS